MAKTKVKSKTKKLKTLVTPDGVAAFAFLREPDTRFDEKFRINVFFDVKDSAVKKFFKVLKALENSWLQEQGKKAKPAKALAGCIKRADENLAELVGVKVGAPYIKFETKPKQGDDGKWIPIPVIGADGKRTNRFVYGTDLVAIETNVAGWATPQGLGIKCYLAAVQLLESRYEGANAGSQFGVREDFMSDEDDDESGPDIEDDASLEGEDDLDLDLEGDEGEDDELGEDEDPAGGMV